MKRRTFCPNGTISFSASNIDKDYAPSPLCFWRHTHPWKDQPTTVIKSYKIHFDRCSFSCSRGRARTQLQLLPRSLQKTAASSAPAPSSQNSNKSSEEKTEAKSGNEPKQGFSNEYFRNLMQRKNWVLRVSWKTIGILTGEFYWKRVEKVKREREREFLVCLFAGFEYKRPDKRYKYLSLSWKRRETMK